MNLQDRIETLLHKRNWGRYQYSVEAADTEAPLEAHITNTWHINIKHGPLLSKLDSALAQTRTPQLFLGKDNLDAMLIMIVDHEIGHWEYCPFDWDNHAEILQGAIEGVQDVKLRQPPISLPHYTQLEPDETTKQIARRLTNMFDDIIDDVANMYRNPRKEHYADGFIGFYALEAERNQGFTKTFATFIDCICKLGTDAYKNFTEQYATTYDPALTRQALDIFTQSHKLTQRAIHGQLQLQDKVAIYHSMMEKTQWKSKAREFARLLTPHLEENEKNQTHKQSGQIAEQDQTPGQPAQTSKPNQLANQAAFAQAMEEHLPEMIKHAIRKGQRADFAPSGEFIDELYKQRAEEIAMSAEEDGETTQLAITHLQKQPLHPHSNVGNVDWHAPQPTLQDNQIQLQFFEKHTPYTHALPGADKGTALPDILLMIDSSGSMTYDYNPHEGSGTYDTLMRAVYSVFKHLEDKGYLYHMKLGTVLFEGKPNYFSGWHEHSSMIEAKKPLLESHKYGQGIGTQLEHTTIRNAIDENPNKFWAILVSDGGVNNPTEARLALNSLRDAGNTLSYIKVGGCGLDTIVDCAKQLGQVIKLQSDTDLRGMLLEQTDATYD